MLRIVAIDHGGRASRDRLDLVERRPGRRPAVARRHVAVGVIGEGRVDRARVSRREEIRTASCNSDMSFAAMVLLPVANIPFRH